VASGAANKEQRSWLAHRQQTIREWLVLAAAVTAGVVGFMQISDERNARQSAEEEARHIERQEQASEISAWIDPDAGFGEGVILSNRSHQPVYQAVIPRVTIQANGFRTGRQISQMMSSQEQQEVSVIPPGEYSPPFPDGFGGMSQ